MDRIFGIDLGTTNSAIAYTDSSGVTEVIGGKDGSCIVPSAVYFPKNGDPVVGAAAKQRAITEPDRVARLFKRGMGERTFLENRKPFAVDGRVWSPEELSALVLRKLAQMAQERYGEPARRAVIAAPSYFGEAERAAAQLAGEIAGLEVLRVLNEPIAAALAHRPDHLGEPGRILVFHLGGSTFDVTVIDVRADGGMAVVATGGDRQLGGTDFDKLVVQKMTDVADSAGLDLITEAWARQEAYLRIEAEEMKKELSARETTSRLLTGSGPPLQFDLSRGEFDGLIEEKLREVGDITLCTIEQAGLQPPDITAVLMVGGSSRIPAFRKLLAAILAREPVLSPNPDEDVVRGAAIVAANPGGEFDPRSHLASLPGLVEVVTVAIGGSALVPFINALASKAAGDLYDEKLSKLLFKRSRNKSEKRSSKDIVTVADDATRIIIDLPRSLDSAAPTTLATILQVFSDRTVGSGSLWLRLHPNESGDGWIVTSTDSRPDEAITLPQPFLQLFDRITLLGHTHHCRTQLQLTHRIRSCRRPSVGPGRCGPGCHALNTEAACA
jgi:molecular chaperone DnaK